MQSEVGEIVACATGLEALLAAPSIWARQWVSLSHVSTKMRTRSSSSD
jgi:hypothetical protein